MLNILILSPTRKLRTMAHMNIDELPIGTAIEIMHIDDTGSYVAHLIKGFDKQWRRITDGAVVSADLIRSWSTRISLIK